jgi:hypothetical protein
VASESCTEEEEEEEFIRTSQKYIITIFFPHIIKTELAQDI